MTLLILLGSLLPAVAPDGTFCAVRLEVTDDQGRPVSGEYRLVYSAGNVGASGTVKDGRAEVCDWEFGVYSLKVTKPGFYSTVIDPVHFIYGHSQLLRIVLNPYVRHGVTDSRCLCYFRVRDSAGGLLSGVEVKAGDQVLHTDQYGRVEVVSAGCQDLLARFEKPGYVAAVERVDFT